MLPVRQFRAPNRVQVSHSVHRGRLIKRTDSTDSPDCLPIHLSLFLISFSTFYRAMLCIRSTSHGPVSVRLSQVGVLLKRLNVGSHKQHHTIVQGLSFFLKPKVSAKFDRGHPLRGRQMQVGWVKISDFRQITGYISKTVQDRRMVSIKVE